MAKLEPKELTLSRILDAARARFRQYGYNKATLAEIAKDCSMSTANLYRFYESKLDIEATLASEFLLSKEAALQKAATSPGLTYPDRLFSVIIETVHYGYNLKLSDSKISEMIEHVLTQRKDLVQKHRRARQSILTRLFEEGKQAGEFHIDDAYATAQSVRAAITLFDTPQLTQAYPIEELERLAANVCSLILYGITTPPEPLDMQEHPPVAESETETEIKPEKVNNNN